ncbi:MAG TPA: hypothetical protein VK806_12235 [Bacteroidia bacterium]|jgi:hypothetical protein|nr:hypothetical protein [Bacteroidia bacterium]
MRKIHTLLLLVVTLLAFYSCKNDLNILAPYKDIPVVYGLMDQSDSAHYIRINKAYLGPGNAITMASNYDSINYPTGTLSVQIKEIDPSGNPLNNYTLIPDSSIPVAPGTFSYPKQVLYKIKAVFNQANTYNLTITNKKTGKTVTGSTGLLPDISFTGTSNEIITDPQFSPSYGTYPTSITWNSNGIAPIYQFTIRFFYTETNGSNVTSKYADWVFAPITSTSGAGFPMQVSYFLSDFLQFLKGTIAVNPVITRTADSLHFIFTMGSSDLNTYIELSQPSLGIDQNTPSFSDVTNGIGLFTARHVSTYSKTSFSGRTIDSLRLSPTTAPLNF